MKKHILILIVASVLVFCLLPISVFADDQGINVYLSVSVNGNIKKTKDNSWMVLQKIFVSDKDGDNTYTINDAMICAHEQCFPEYSTENTGYDIEGKKAIKIWGISLDNVSFTHARIYASASALMPSNLKAVTDVTTKIYDKQIISVRNNDSPTTALFFADIPGNL